MSNPLIIEHLSKYISLSPEESAYFLSLLTEKKLRRRQHLLREGEICYHSTFVLEGCLRGYTVDKNGYEHILQFAPPGWWITDMYSLLSGQAGDLFIEALEPSELQLLHIRDREKLIAEIPKFERFFRIIAENSLVNFRQRLMGNLGLSARERYLSFCRRYPTLIECLPQKQIALYIGVTPEFLSKMRAALLKERKR
ncbi:MAG TPA: Crp/Fnr family transcriptional regulator [Saprospiraceae bacterium]|nr:Crp/Fnr family transcriptional regulator [Saprospiraceae bacterium]